MAHDVPPPVWTRDALVATRKKEITVDGSTMVLRALTSGEALAYRGKNLGTTEILQLIAMSICDPVLTPEDAALVPSVTMDKIILEVFVFNKLGDKAVEEAQAELKKTKP